MNILVTGSNTSGSWKIRGEQLGHAIGAIARTDAVHLKGFDLAIVVKRPTPALIGRLRKFPIVWDVVDAWPQPGGNAWDYYACMRWFVQQVEILKPKAIVAATKAMARDCEQFGVPVLTLPHHARPGLTRNPIRSEILTVGYEGGQYLGVWAQWLRDACQRRHWSFVVNPRSLADLDIVVAFREMNGYAVSSWKSNVKLANAQGSGTPCVMAREAGSIETASGAELWADSVGELDDAFDKLEAQQERLGRAELMLNHAPQLTDVATTYKDWLHAL